MENLGLVGFTGAGANRLFSALTGLPAPSEYEAAVGIATVPDERLDRLAAMSESKKVVPAGFELVHLALPPGAKPGEGPRREVPRRAAQQRRDPHRAARVRRRRGRARSRRRSRRARARARDGRPRRASSTGSTRHRKARRRRPGDRRRGRGARARARRSCRTARRCTAADLERRRPRRRSRPRSCLTTKPMLVVCNTGEEVGRRPRRSPARSRCRSTSRPRSRRATPDDRAEMREMYGVGESALDAGRRAAYHLLGRRTFLTTGDKESRAWTFRAGAKAPECAGVIHTDLQRGFIRAEVIRLGRAARDRFVVQGARRGQAARRGQGLRGRRRRRARDPLQRVTGE